MLHHTDFRVTTVGDRVFDLSIAQRPGSIRDSVVRAEEFARGLLSDKAIWQKRSAIVVGMGPSGMAVAATLLKAGVRVTAYSKRPPEEDDALDYCNRREVCPTTFDHPAPWWACGTTPLSGDECVFAWNKGLASIVYGTILDQFNAIVDQRRALYAGVSGADIKRIFSDSLSASLEAHIDGKPDSRTSDVVIVSVGPGREKNLLHEAPPGAEDSPQFCSFRFWSDTDPRFDQSLGGQKFLIVGGGDGGLGEFASLVTGHLTPRSIIESLGISDTVMEKLWGASRAMWAACNAAPRSHAGSAKAFEDILAIADVAWKEDPALARNCRRALAKDSHRPHVQVALSCAHFGISFCANQVSAILLARALVERGPRANGNLVPVRIGVECSDIRGSGRHSCRSDPQKCARYPHMVQFKRDMNCHLPTTCSGYGACAISGGAPSIFTTTVEEQEFDRILLRGGTSIKHFDVPEEILKFRKGNGRNDASRFYTEQVEVVDC